MSWQKSSPLGNGRGLANGLVDRHSGAVTSLSSGVFGTRIPSCIIIEAMSKYPACLAHLSSRRSKMLTHGTLTRWPVGASTVPSGRRNGPVWLAGELVLHHDGVALFHPAQRPYVPVRKRVLLLAESLADRFATLVFDPWEDLDRIFGVGRDQLIHRTPVKHVNAPLGQSRPFPISASCTVMLHEVSV